MKFAEAFEFSEVVQSQVFEVQLTEVGEVYEVRGGTGAVSLHEYDDTTKYIATNYSMNSCGRSQKGLCFTISEMGWTVTLDS